MLNWHVLVYDVPADAWQGNHLGRAEVEIRQQQIHSQYLQQQRSQRGGLLALFVAVRSASQVHRLMRSYRIEHLFREDLGKGQTRHLRQ